MAASYPLLETLRLPEGVRDLSASDLQRLADEVRARLIACTSKTGGHLGAGLGVVELTVALHHVFQAPVDKIIWDVSHQTYPHKILTGRNERMESLRQEGGLSGFAKRSESPYDAFGAGHSSTSVSAALGMAEAHRAKNESRDVVAVIGDGALSAGMAYEALNNAGALGTRMIVVLNDNKMSIAPAVGAMSRYLNRLRSSGEFRHFRDSMKLLASYLPAPMRDMAERGEQCAKALAGKKSNIFEELGFLYIGPVDGHDVKELATVFRNLKEAKDLKRPALVHVLTEKGKGFAMPDVRNEKLHAVGAFDPEAAAPLPSKKGPPSYTSVFAQTLTALAEKDPRVFAITAAMPSGTGLDAFAARFPERYYDVGIAEQHAVTFAAGLAAEGMKPFCAIYSTFLQRAYDQIIHDVAIQKLPVRFMIDRAGLVGSDGATHAGSFDSAFLGCVPEMALMAPSDEAELVRMVATALAIDDRPSAVRYPRGEGTGATLPEIPEPLALGKGRIVREGGNTAILSYGDLLTYALAAADRWKNERNLSITVADARFLKPLDTGLVRTLLDAHEKVFLLESGSAGGFAAHVWHAFAGKIGVEKLRPLCLPDVFLDHATQERQYATAGLDAEGIYKAALAEFVDRGLKSL
ncbi:MAG: 1-deoxy-D-xylulose-5-phosphate synthase [Rickettsiales bacterium]